MFTGGAEEKGDQLVIACYGGIMDIIVSRVVYWEKGVLSRTQVFSCKHTMCSSGISLMD